MLGTEKNNDEARRNYMSSNHFDAPREILLADVRLEKLRMYQKSKEAI